MPALSMIDFTVMDDKQYKGAFKKVSSELEIFTKNWNADDSNRDKTFTAFNKLSATKEEMQDSLKHMLERDGKIEESLAKG